MLTKVSFNPNPHLKYFEQAYGYKSDNWDQIKHTLEKNTSSEALPRVLPSTVVIRTSPRFTEPRECSVLRIPKLYEKAMKGMWEVFRSIYTGENPKGVVRMIGPPPTTIAEDMSHIAERSAVGVMSILYDCGTYLYSFIRN